MSESLRAALGAAPDPEFSIMLPEGWVRMDATEASRDDVLAAAKSRLMSAHRPELWGAVRSSLIEAFDSLRRSKGVAVMLPMESGDGVPFMPASLTAAMYSSAGEPLDEFIAGLIRQGATALGGDKRFIRLETREVVTRDGVQLGVTTVRYLTPVPGSQRTRALLFTAVMPHEPDTADDNELLSSIRFSMDAHVSTVRWLVAGEGAAS